MRSFVIGLLVLCLVLFVASTTASGCDKCGVVGKPVAVKTAVLPNYVLPVRVVVLPDGTVVPKHPVVLGVRKVVRTPLVLTKKVVRPPLVLARRVVRVPFRVLGLGCSR